MGLKLGISRQLRRDQLVAFGTFLLLLLLLLLAAAAAAACCAITCSALRSQVTSFFQVFTVSLHVIAAIEVKK